MSKSSNTSPVLRATVVLPFALPTENLILSLGLRRRIMLKKFIRDTVSQLIIEAGGSRTPLGAVIRPRWTALSEAVYSQMTARHGLKRSRKKASGRTSTKRS